MSNHLRDLGGGRILDRTPAAREDLVTINGFGGRRIILHRDAAQAYENLLNAAQSEAGINGSLLRITSGYRSPEVQHRLWQQALQKYGSPQLARRWVAPPGRSAHQTGRALDFHLGVPIGSRYVNQQRQTQAYKWIQNNAHRFGFYPYEREPWHWEFNPPKQTLREANQKREQEEFQRRQLAMTLARSGESTRSKVRPDLWAMPKGGHLPRVHHLEMTFGPATVYFPGSPPVTYPTQWTQRWRSRW